MDSPFSLPDARRPKRVVNPYVRVVLVVYAIFSVWQVYWLIKAAAGIESIIPAIQSVWHWVAAWGVVGLASAVGAVTGRDLPARLGFGAMSVASVCAAATILLSGWPMEGQFYAFGEAVVLAAASLVMLLSPMRPVPSTHHLIDFSALLDGCDPGIEPTSGARERTLTGAP